MLKLILISVLAAGVAAPAAARPKDDKTQRDPNRVICKTEESTGSRLQIQKTCMTQAEWAQLEVEQRHSVERVQSNRSGGGSQ